MGCSFHQALFILHASICICVYIFLICRYVDVCTCMYMYVYIHPLFDAASHNGCSIAIPASKHSRRKQLRKGVLETRTPLHTHTHVHMHTLPPPPPRAPPPHPHPLTSCDEGPIVNRSSLALACLKLPDSLIIPSPPPPLPPPAAAASPRAPPSPKPTPLPLAAVVAAGAAGAVASAAAAAAASSRLAARVVAGRRRVAFWSSFSRSAVYSPWRWGVGS